MIPSDRLRVTIAGAIPLTIQPTALEADGFAPADRGELVRQLPPAEEDRLHGALRFEIVVGGWRFEALVERAARAALREKAVRVAEGHQAHAAVTLRAQIPGRVVRVWVAEGEHVEQGQRLLAVEAMKMENEIRAPHAGVVQGLRVALEQKVERGDELLNIA